MTDEFVPLIHGYQLKDYIYFATGAGQWSSSQKRDIFDQLVIAFDGSPTFREMINSYLHLLYDAPSSYQHYTPGIPFDGALWDGSGAISGGNSPGLKKIFLRIGQHGEYLDENAVEATGGWLTINPAVVANATYINKSGVAVSASLISIIIHELSHVAKPSFRNRPNCCRQFNRRANGGSWAGRGLTGFRHRAAKADAGRWVCGNTETGPRPGWAIAQPHVRIDLSAGAAGNSQT